MFGSSKGFTLVELLIVIAILGALSSIGVFRFVGAQKSALDARRKAELKEYQTAIEVYASNNNTVYPIHNGKPSVLCTNGTLSPSDCPDDPKTGTTGFDYMYGSATGSAYILYAKMERSASPTLSEYFVLCSTGKSGLTTTSTAGKTDCTGIVFLP